MFLSEFKDHQKVPLWLCVDDIIKKTPEYEVVECSVLFSEKDGKKIPLKGKVKLYFEKNTFTPERGKIYLITFLKNNFIYQASSDKDPSEVFRDAVHNYILTGNVKNRSCYELLSIRRWNDFIYRWRDRILNFMNRELPDREVYALAASMWLGDRKEINYTMMNRFSITGVIHILSVSGLHVGLLYTILIFFLRGINFSFIQRFIIIFLILWLYAMLCGMNPPVIRAVIMCLIIELFKRLPYSSSPVELHALVFCAFCFLMFNPFLIFDLSFQLSFSSMTGLLVLVPKLNRFIPSDCPRLIRVVSDSFLITFCTSLTTLPFILYSFHSFSFMSFLSNIILVPLSFVFMISVLFIILPFSWVKLIPLFAGKLLLKFTGFLSWLGTPVYFTNIFFTSYDFFFCILFVFFFTAWIYRRHFFYFKLMLGLACVWMLISCMEVWKTKRSVMMMAENVRNKIHILFKNRNRIYVSYDSTPGRRSDRFLTQSAYPDKVYGSIHGVVIRQPEKHFWFNENFIPSLKPSADSMMVFTTGWKNYKRWLKVCLLEPKMKIVYLRRNTFYLRKFE